MKPMSPFSVTLAAAILLAGASQVQAAQWRNEPFFKSSVKYDDNVRFVADQKEDSAGVVLDLGVSMINESESVETAIQPRLSFRGYASQSDLNTTDAYLDLITRMRGLRSNLGFVVGFAHDSAISSELQDTGRVTINARRNRVSISPSWEYRLSPRNSIELGYNYQNVQWSDNENAGLLDNNINEVFGQFKRRLNEHDDMTLKLSQSDFESPDSGFQSTTIGASAGFVRRFSEVNSIELEAGGWNTDLSAGTGSETKSGGSFGATLVHQEEVYTYRLGLGQSVVPSSAGQVRQDRRLTGYLDYRTSPRLHWGVDALFIQAGRIGDVTTEQDRDYFAVRPFMAWDWTRKLSLSASVRFSGQTFKSTDTSSDRTELLMTLAYGKQGI